MKQSAVYLKYSGQGFAYDAIALCTHEVRSRSVPKTIALRTYSQTNVSDRSFHSCLRSRFYSFKMSIVPVNASTLLPDSIAICGMVLTQEIGVWIVRLNGTVVLLVNKEKLGFLAFSQPTAKRDHTANPHRREKFSKLSLKYKLFLFRILYHKISNRLHHWGKPFVSTA